MTSSLMRALRFKTLAPELRWFYSRLRLKQEAGVSKHDEALREILRCYPWWSRGHFLLGELYLRSFERAGERPEPRNLAAVRVSGQAILDLSQDSKELSEPLGHYLLAMSAFYARNYDKALREFKYVLAPEVSNDVPVKYGIKALETAGAAAMALQETESAERFFSAIPEQNRTPETLSALRYLEAVRLGELPSG